MGAPVLERFEDNDDDGGGSSYLNTRRSEVSCDCEGGIDQIRYADHGLSFVSSTRVAVE